MPWIRIDDHFDEHPKLQEVGPLGWGFWLAGLAYCNRNLTDGFIPWTKARTLCSFELADEAGLRWELARTSGMAGEDVTADWVIQLLIDAGLWDVVQNDKGRIDGYVIHDYEDYQPTREQVEADRAKKVAAGQAGGKASAQARAQAPAQAESKQNPTPYPYPYPSPNQEKKSISRKREGVKELTKHDSDVFEWWWSSLPKKVGKKACVEWWKKHRPADEQAKMMAAAIERQKKSRRWRDGYVPDPLTWLNGERWNDELEPADGATKPRPPGGDHLVWDDGLGRWCSPEMVGVVL